MTTSGAEVPLFVVALRAAIVQLEVDAEGVAISELECLADSVRHCGCVHVPEDDSLAFIDLVWETPETKGASHKACFACAPKNPGLPVLVRVVNPSWYVCRLVVTLVCFALTSTHWRALASCLAQGGPHSGVWCGSGAGC